MSTLECSVIALIADKNIHLIEYRKHVHVVVHVIVNVIVKLPYLFVPTYSYHCAFESCSHHRNWAKPNFCGSQFTLEYLKIQNVFVYLRVLLNSNK